MEHLDVEDAARVQALCELGLLDTPQESRFDRLTRLACAAFQAPIALVSLVDGQRQWFKSRAGLDAFETPRSQAFCSHTVAKRAQLIVPDATLDVRFRDNPLVTGAPHIRFYAGHPVHALNGHAVGTLCIIDRVARDFTAQQCEQLRDLAALVEDEINRNAVLRARHAAERKLAQLHSDLELRVAERTRSLRDANDALKHEIDQRCALEDTLRASEKRIRTIIESSLSAFISIDTLGRIIDWNGSAERTFGWQQAEVAGLDLANIIIPERHRAAHRHGMARMLATGEAQVLNRRLELPAITRGGTEITVEMTISSFAANDTVCFGAFLHDITERELARRALAQKQEMLDAILDSVDVGVVACDAQGKITLFNRAARELHGLPAEALDPRDWATHYDLFDANGTERLKQADIPLFRAWQGEVVKNAAMSIAPRGRPVYKLMASGRRMQGVGGELLGAVVVMSDITELADSRNRIEAGQQRLHAITENMPALIGQVDKHGNFSFLNSIAVRFYGKPMHELIGHSVQSAYSAEEFAKLAPHMALALQGQRTVFEDEATVRGRSLHYQATYVPNIRPDGTADGFFAMAFDITQRKHSELRQRDSEERLRLITDNLPVLISYIDCERRFGFANAMHERWLGIAPSDIIGKSLRDVLGPDYAAAPEAALDACLAGQQVEGDMQLPAVGAPRTVHSLLVPHRRGAEVVGAYLLTTDVTAARLHEQQLKTMAMTDALTGLANRRSYDIQLASAIRRANRKRVGMALAYLDIDHFKVINDTLGHALGDEVLKEFARRLGVAMRKSDIVCRLAGDEFTIILEDVKTSDRCTAVGRKIMAALQPPFVLGQRTWNVTASVGIAWTDGVATDVTALQVHADTALYQAKTAGRNQIAVYADGQSPP